MESEDFKMEIGEEATDFNLSAVDGRQYSRHSFISKGVMVLVFTCNHCPYAKAYEKRLFELAKEFEGKVAFAAINSNDATKYPEDNFERMKEYSNEKGFPYPYLHDQSQEVAKEYGALVTPHVFVFDKQRKLVYQGTVDDNWEHAENVSKTYLYDALIQVTEGKKVKTKTTPVIGCSIKWK